MSLIDKFKEFVKHPSDKSESSKDLLSYASFLSDMRKFRVAGTRNSEEFNYFDTPAHHYFKILFNFWNGDVDNPGAKELSGGLLSPAWNYANDVEGYMRINSAWSYLMLNDEVERAENLKHFIELLSNISTYSPWYFLGIEGLDAARARAVTMSSEFKFEERSKITIKCLNDSYDDRIGTLLDLYKSIVWSWSDKKEILPSNLRKFDMAIYIFSSPVYNIHDYNKNYAGIGDKYSGYITSYKYIELHDCEIDYNATSSGFPTLDNAGGVSPQYSIDIYFNDLYENRYNEFMMRNIGDMIAYDTSMFLDKISNNSEARAKIESEAEDRMFAYKNRHGMLASMANDAIEWAKARGKTFITSKYLGNIYGFSIKDTIMDINQIKNDGKLFVALDAANDAIKRIKGQSSNRLKHIRNIFESNSIKNNI